MAKIDQIKYHSKEKAKSIKNARTTKLIGIVSSCASIATLVACLFNRGNNPQNIYLNTLVPIELLVGIMFLRISYQETKNIQHHKKQLKKLQKQR